MKSQKRNRNWLTAAMLVVVAATPAQALRGAGPITARAAILIDNNTGEVLWERNPDLQLPPASTTKVLTAMVALRSGRLEDSFLVSREAANEPPSKVHLKSGWRVRLLDLIYAIMLNSANDASVVIAEGIAGSVPAFATLMNAQARRLGAVNSNFVNPNGLPDANHYSTARDLATLFSVAARDPLFDRIASTQGIPIIPTEGGFRAINLRTHNRLLTNYRYEVIGKTGWTIAAKRCFVGAARVDGRELVFAVLGARDLWGDVRKLIEFGFNDSARPDVEMVRAETEEVVLRARASGDDEDADDEGYSGRTSRVLRSTKVKRQAAAPRPRVSTAKAQQRSTVAKGSMRRSAKSNVVGKSGTKSNDERKRKASQLAKRANQQQGVRKAQSVRPATRSARASQARASAVKASSKDRSKSERPRPISKTKTSGRR